MSLDQVVEELCFQDDSKVKVNFFPEAEEAKIWVHLEMMSLRKIHIYKILHVDLAK